MAQDLPLVVRTDTLTQVDALISLGVAHVVQPELEAALEMARQSLIHLDIEPARIQRFLDASRREHYGPDSREEAGYASLRGIGHATQLLDLQWIQVQDGSPFAGSRIGELQVRSQTGVSIVAVVREREIRYNPGPKQVIEVGDWLGVIGRTSQVEAVARLAVPAAD